MQSDPIQCRKGECVNKVLILSVLTALLLMSQACAGRKGWSYGAKAGLNSANIAFADDGFSQRIRFCGGCYIEFPLSLSVSLQPELLYTQKGAVRDVSVPVWNPDGTFRGNYDFRTTITLDYIEVPILLTYTLAGAWPVEPYLLGGPSVAFKVEGNSVTQFMGKHLGYDMDYVRRADWGLIAGGGVGLPTDRAQVALEVRYGLGLAAYSDGIDNRNSVVSILVTFGSRPATSVTWW
jgi:hypothetical protein